jgi:hypothetical protein
MVGGKEAYLIAADVNGNFFLHHCDGSVRYWVHSKRSDVVVSKSVKDFARSLREDHNNTLSWWKKRDDPPSA